MARKGKAAAANDDTNENPKRARRKGLDPVADFDQPVKRKQARLPGMEDAPIKDLEEAAVEYSDIKSEIRERRDALKLADERLATLMKKLGKTAYVRDGVRLKLRAGRDSVSVQVKRHDAETD